MNQNLIIGSNGNVCAIDPQTGTEIWRTRLQEGVFNATHLQDVSVLVRDRVVYAGCQGHLFAISADSGQVLWHNELKGLRYNDISLAFEGQSIQFLQKTIRTHGSSNQSS